MDLLDEAESRKYIPLCSDLFSDESIPTSPPSYQIQELKSLTRHRFRLISYRGKLKVSFARIIDVVFMFITVDLMTLPPLACKFISNIIQGIINYLAGKLIIFRKK